MRNKSNIKISIIILGIVFAFLSINYYNIYNDQGNIDGTIEIRDESNLKRLKKSGGYSESFIHVDGSIPNNWSWTAGNYSWCYIENGVYIIENVTIDAGSSPTGSGIYIENSKNDYFIIRNCTVYNAGGKIYEDAGIRLENTNNGTLKNNNCSHNVYHGIFLFNDCDNNTISGNNVNNNWVGITFGHLYAQEGGDDNKISGNTANNNSYYGIWLAYNSHNNTILGNTVNNNTEYGIRVEGDCKDITISGNTVCYNTGEGIYISGNRYTISQNTANYNRYRGITITGNYNNVSENTANYNAAGIRVYYHCGSNIVSGNIANNNTNNGILIRNHADKNNITGNTANSNGRYGIYIQENSDFNNITENHLEFNSLGAIGVESADCNDNIITKNILISKELAFIFNAGTNTFISLNYYGRGPPSFVVDVIAQSFSYTEFIMTFNITSETGFGPWEQFIQIWWNGIVVPSNNIIELGDNLYNVSLTPIFVDLGEDPILLNMTISADYHIDKYFETYIAVSPSDLEEDILELEIIAQSFSIEHFNITFFIHNTSGYGIEFATIQMWWNGVDVSSDVQDLGSGYYFVSLDAITVAPGEDPILLKMTISASGYEDKYFEKYIAVEPCEIINYLQVEITEHSYSLKHFNLTFFIYDEAGQGIAFAIIQMWWNGTDVSDDVMNIGSGLYFVSLEPITVAPGEDPILLKMVISASGYEDKLFETYLAVDPDTLDKVGRPAEGVPLIIILIAIISTAAGIGVATVTVVLLRRRRRLTEA